ncbi:hypothetical protein QR680_009692 [Steinernema hermaphroditum]|uniref:Uncharacterized protein n=1 Tax=Steinernema hermaphroditum TaxID=289476 RepID=A0AA39M9X6_9BILA|nr:hypothetical protein QR680_009692 [Steinernema hermaphroditum]
MIRKSSSCRCPRSFTPRRSRSPAPCECLFLQTAPITVAKRRRATGRPNGPGAFQASSRTRRSSHHEAIDECSKPQRSKSKAQKREKPDAKRRSLRAAPAEGTSEPAKGAEVWSSPFGERPPFDLGTRIEAYEDVDESGRYRRRGGPRKVKVDRHKQEELNQQWADSLRE